MTVTSASSSFNVVVPTISAALEADVDVDVSARYYLRFDLLKAGANAGEYTNGATQNRDGSYQADVGIAFNEARLTELPVLYNDGTAQTSPAAFLEVVADGQAVIYSIRVNNGATATIARDDGSIEWDLADDGIRLGCSDAARQSPDATACTLSPTQEDTYYLRASIWNGRGDAQRADFVNLGSQAPIWTGINTIALTKRTANATVRDPRTITATVTSNFRDFRPENDNPGPPLGTGTTGATSAGMGRLSTVEAWFQDGFIAGSGMAMPPRITHDILDHQDGHKILVQEVIERVNASITGDNGAASYNFARYYLNDSCTTGAGMATTTTATYTPLSGALVTATGSAFTRVVPAPTAVGSGPLLRDQAVFCANVTENVEGQDPEVFARIEAVEYTMNLGVKLVGITTPVVYGPHMANQSAGEIDRDGTVVRIAYLTTAEDFGATRTWQADMRGTYNQRLVIVNHSNAPVPWSLGDFTQETNINSGAVITAELSETCELRGRMRCVSGMDAVAMPIPANTTLTYPVRDLLTITNGNRSSGLVTLVGAPDDLSVATVQVTLPEGQTDTVRYHPLNESR